MRVIGLTGGSGAGKTTVLRLIADHGGEILDCDRLYYEMLKTDEPFRRELAAAFDGCFGENGEVDRLKLGARVFGNEAELRKLNEIVYYYMGLEVRRRLIRWKAEGCRLVGIDAVNLIDSGLSELCETTVAVLAPEAQRVKRITERDGITEAQALRRIRAQKTDDYYRKYAKRVLENESDEQTLLRNAEALLGEYF